MSLIRTERWGLVRYDPELDEFEAEAAADLCELPFDRPLSAGCLITGKCNLRCQYCYGNDEALPTTELGAVTWRRIFRILRGWGLMRVDISGGEPTLRRDVDEICRSASEIGLNVVLSTNGLVLNPRRLAALPRTTRLHISVDSGDEEIHNRSRLLRNLVAGADTFARTTQMIVNAVDGRDKIVLGSIFEMTLDDLRQSTVFNVGLHARKWIAATIDFDPARIRLAG